MRRLESTRSDIYADDLTAVLQGIAPDGGLYVDPELGSLYLPAGGMVQYESMEIAAKVLETLLPGFSDPAALVSKGYKGKFSCGDIITPLVPLSSKLSVLELFHGPTSAFKDVALSLLPLLMSEAREKTDPDREIVILTATSGDTGKAALEGFRDVPGIRILVFYPLDGVSEIQRKQMVSQQGSNVGVCAVKGNFDDCQTAVKKAFLELQDGDLLKGVSLSSANSINIGRLVPQVFYYYSAYVQLVSTGRIRSGEAVDFVVPTGNFGDILAGYIAKRIGLPIEKLVCASNANNVLTDFFRTGTYDAKRPFYHTYSPSMDILVSSNLERLLYYVSSGGREFVSDCMRRLQEEGRYTVPESIREEMEKDFAAYYSDETETKRTIRSTFETYRYLPDPHTAVGLAAADQYLNEVWPQRQTVVLSTASPYKFTPVEMDALKLKKTGSPYDDMRVLSEKTGTVIPENLLELENAEERFTDVTDRDSITDYVLDFIGKGGSRQ